MNVHSIRPDDHRDTDHDADADPEIALDPAISDTDDSINRFGGPDPTNAWAHRAITPPLLAALTGIVSRSAGRSTTPCSSCSKTSATSTG